MYYPLGLPKCLSFPINNCENFKSVVCNRDRILYAILSDRCVWIWFAKPCVPLAVDYRDEDSINLLGENILLEWRPDSSMLVIAHKEVFEQIDSQNPSFRRDSAELYTKESIPPLVISKVFEINVTGGVTCLVNLRDELMVGTGDSHIQRIKWDGSLYFDYCVDLRRVPFCDDQLVMKAVPLEKPGIHIIHLEYSPLAGGFATILSDGRGAFLTASTLQFDPNAIQGIWAKGMDDAVCTAINHKYRLLAYGRKNSEGIVFMIDDATGGLEPSHNLVLSSKDHMGCPGSVVYMKWTPDGAVLGMCWEFGGISLWSVYGCLLTSSLGWDYNGGPKSFAFIFSCIEWGAEGYELWCINGKKEKDALSNAATHGFSQVILMSFLKSALTVNPCMSRVEKMLLQGSDRLYLSTSDGLEVNSSSSFYDAFNFYFDDDDDESALDETPKSQINTFSVTTNKQWAVVPIPYAYISSNWPVRYTCVDDKGEVIGVAGRNGVAHYSLKQRKWHLFGNESQEEDFVVTGGLLWWNSWLVLGAYNIVGNADELRFYPRDQKLDNEFASIILQQAQVLLINVYCDQLIVLTADCRITVYNLQEPDIFNGYNKVCVTRVQEVDISGLTVHPACVVSIYLTSLRTESWKSHSSHPVQPPAQSIIFNITGKVLMIQRDHFQNIDNEESDDGKLFQNAMMTPIVLASCCEILWCSSHAVSHKPHLSHALWLHCGIRGTRAWLPLFPNAADKSHTFMARRIMLPFTPSIYPLAVLFKDGMLLGVDTDTSLLTCDKASLYQPLTIVGRTSEIYLHQLLRQLLRRNLGYHAWEVASTCKDLPYFPHSLELLLHQVLEEEATSKEPIPDSLLPRILKFISEFPVYLSTVVQCARKTELALWRYLFASAGSPRHLFTRALETGQLDTAASFLIILQNMESASVCRVRATRLLDATLDAGKWELSKDLIRFLRSIDPTDLDAPKANIPQSGSTRVGFSHVTPPVSPSCADEDLSMILPNTQALRSRTFSTTSTPKISTVDGPAISSSTVMSKTTPESAKNESAKRKRASNSFSRDVSSAEEYFLDVILQRHSKKLLLGCHLRDLGTMAAHLDFPLVSWLRRERTRAARVDDFVAALRHIHDDFSWPYPSTKPASVRRPSGSSICSSNDRLEKRMQNLTISVSPSAALANGEIGDSGYLSQATGTGDTFTPQHTLHSPTVTNGLQEFECARQAILFPATNLDALSVKSEEGSIIDDVNSLASEWGIVTDPTRDLLDRPPDPPPQPTPNPPPHSEIQLRYLLQVLLEAGCLEWSIIVAIVLRDALAVLRVITLARSSDTPTQTISRLASGLYSLQKFTAYECLGYQNFMCAIMGQVKILEKAASQREAFSAQEPATVSSSSTTISKTPPSSRPSSVEAESGAVQSRASHSKGEHKASLGNISVSHNLYGNKCEIVDNHIIDIASDNASSKVFQEKEESSMCVIS